MIGGIVFIFVNGSSILSRPFFERLDINLPSSMLAVWGMVWCTTNVVALHLLAIIKGKGFLRLFYLVFLWLFQSYLIGLAVYGNINKDHYVQFLYIATFSFIVLISYCIFFSPLLFLKLHINPRSNVLFRILDDLNRNFERAQNIECAEEVEAEDLIGTVGISETILRPTGRGRFNEHSLQITTRGEFISAHIPIKIIQESGGLYLVEEYAESNNEQRGQGIT